ncbi:vitamin B12/cobalamin outer membrane transporter [Janthinobacterium lividum]|nr:vitamin B12/cobalamin outer membrane transporter [Janthinobacterium lividum]
MTPRSLPLLLAALFSATAAHADDIFQRVLIDGSRLNQLGVADSANAGSVTQQQLDARTSYRPGELLEAVPGLIVSQHSGEGKANQFYLRGFNLDHGTDLRTMVDEMPVNQRSHGHGQGWTDLNFLIPELAMRLDYKKGPYSAAQGDFSSAGAASVVYANRLTQGIASVGVGQNGFRRALLADTLDAGDGSLLYALEAQHNDGPFTQPDRYRKLNGVLRYSEGYANNGFNVTAMAYDASWNATDQIPLRAVQDGTLGRFDAIDASDGGKAQRYSLSGAWRQTTDDMSSKVSAYVIANRLALFSNFTYAMDDPDNGDQFAQPDRRVTAGLDASHTWHRHTDRGSSDTTIGLQLQNDNIHNGLYNTRQRQTVSTTRQDHIVESSIGVYGENSTRWSRWLRTVAGLRADAYRFDVRSDRAANSGKASDHLFSPSLSVIAGPWRDTEAYINIGNGFIATTRAARRSRSTRRRAKRPTRSLRWCARADWNWACAAPPSPACKRRCRCTGWTSIPSCCSSATRAPPRRAAPAAATASSFPATTRRPDGCRWTWTSRMRAHARAAATRRATSSPAPSKAWPSWP